MLFTVACAIIIVTGSRITAYADELAERTGIQRGFVGVLLLGMVTSLPEVITSVSAVALFGETGMAIGNLLGSCGFNLLIVVILDAIFRLGNAERASVVAGVLSVVMMLIVLGGYFLPDSIPAWYLDPVSLLIVFGYFLSLRRIWLSERDRSVESVSGDKAVAGSLSGLMVKLLVSAAVLVGASIWLSSICDTIAEQTQIGGSIVGAFLMASATSLPELTVSIAAMRMGQMSLSLGNIYGSNIFNIGILSLVDLFEGRGSLFSHLETIHAFIAVQVILMSVLLLVAFRPGAAPSHFRMRPMSALVGFIYIAGTLFLFYNKLSH
jgi:cation:H+ antiporter